MRSVNKVFLLGNLGQDVELRYSQDGRAIGRFRMATHWSRKRDDGSWDEGTDWHTVVVFGKPAETCAGHLRKGSPVFVEGRAKEREYTDRDGNRRWSHEVIAFDVSFLDRDGAGRGAGGPHPAGAESTAAPPAADAEAQEAGADLPF